MITRLQQGRASALDMLQLQQSSSQTIRAAHPQVQKRASRHALQHLQKQQQQWR